MGRVAPRFPTTLNYWLPCALINSDNGLLQVTINPKNVPPIPPDLLAWLDHVFPEKCARPGQSMDEVWHEAGARSVVRRLIVEKERQDKVIYNVPRPT